MSGVPHILLLEDEVLILMDLEMAAEELGCRVSSAVSVDEALALLDEHSTDIDVAVLDVTLGAASTCFPVARQLDRLDIPYLLHSGDLNRHNERIRQLDAALIAKPAPSSDVMGAALAMLSASHADSLRLAAE
jgi:DNA-binding response OmpR family regulator